MKTLLATAALSLALSATPTMADSDCLDEGRHLTVRGTIVESAFTDIWQGREIRQNFLPSRSIGHAVPPAVKKQA